MNILGRKVVKVFRIGPACLGDLSESRLDAVRLCRAQHSCADQAVAVRYARADIDLEQATVERKRLIELGEAFVGLTAESSAPKLIGNLAHHHRCRKQRDSNTILKIGRRSLDLAA